MPPFDIAQDFCKPLVVIVHFWRPFDVRVWCRVVPSRRLFVSTRSGK
jgi:hypothetical protein